jgi:hypothetical protein
MLQVCIEVYLKQIKGHVKDRNTTPGLWESMHMFVLFEFMHKYTRSTLSQFIGAGFFTEQQAAVLQAALASENCKHVLAGDACSTTAAAPTAAAPRRACCRPRCAGQWSAEAALAAPADANIADGQQPLRPLPPQLPPQLLQPVDAEDHDDEEEEEFGMLAQPVLQQHADSDEGDGRENREVGDGDLINSLKAQIAQLEGYFLHAHDDDEEPPVRKNRREEV